MRVAERGNWLAYAWICERTAPHLYALRSVSRVVEEDQQFEEPIPSEILAKHRQFYAEMLLEDQAKSQSRTAADSVEQINQTSGKTNWTTMRVFCPNSVFGLGKSLLILSNLRGIVPHNIRQRS
jgi:hypothetical protein